MKKCFLICPIGDESSVERNRSDQVMNHLIVPVCSDFSIVRADLEYSVAKIDDEIFRHLDNDDLAIADLTGLNPNVFLEVGYRLANKKPIIFIAEKGTPLPFDIKTTRTIFYKLELNEAKKFQDTLSKTLEKIDFTANYTQKKKEPDVFVSDELSRDARQLLKRMYLTYNERRKKGTDISSSAFFGFSPKTMHILNISFNDFLTLSHTLEKNGYVEIRKATGMVEYCNLLDKGIKYGEDHFDEPSHIELLKNIIRQCDINKAMITSNNIENYSEEDIAILVSDDLIILDRYIDGSFSVCPTDKGIAQIAKLDKQ